MQNPYKKSIIMEKTLFNKHRRENFLIELENLLQSSFPNVPTDLSSLTQYSTNIDKIKGSLISLVRKFISSNDWNENYDFSKEQKDKITSLGNILCLSQGELAYALRQGLLDKVRDKVKIITADDAITRAEYEDISALIDGLHISEKEELCSLHPKFLILIYLHALDTNPESLHDENCGLILDSDEFTVGGREGNAHELHEWRKKRTQVFYAGPRYVIPTGIKGLTYRMGSYSVSAPSHDELTLIDYGRFKFTNKRFIFDGEKKNVSIRYHDLMKYDVGKDFVSFEKANGKPIIVKFTDYGREDAQYPASSPIAFRAILAKFVGEEQK